MAWLSVSVTRLALPSLVRELTRAQSAIMDLETRIMVRDTSIAQLQQEVRSFICRTKSLDVHRPDLALFGLF
jgi:hypothetical protein